MTALYIEFVNIIQPIGGNLTESLDYQIASVVHVG